MSEVEIQFARCWTPEGLAHDLPPPTPATEGAAAVDLKSSIATVIYPGLRRRIPLGFAVAIPTGYVGLLLPRSGMASKHGVTLVNSPGVIDPDYRGQLYAALINHSEEQYFIRVGQRIAQLIAVPTPTMRLVEVERLTRTDRGDGGFGSTGD